MRDLFIGRSNSCFDYITSFEFPSKLKNISLFFPWLHQIDRCQTFFAKS